ncbi:hypothetical protein HDU88_004790 [Geranomyces variabilis]|nr:hypothetical protein HDU88_004790 [Geranomyces variabilis]
MDGTMTPPGASASPPQSPSQQQHSLGTSYIARPAGPQERQRLLQKRHAVAVRHIPAPATTAAVPASRICDVCAIAYDPAKRTHHLQSKKHRLALDSKRREGRERGTGKADQQRAPDLKTWSNETECLFCLESGADLDSNIAHMKAAHSFLIPDIEFLAAPVELLAYLGAVIEEGNCLWCHSPEARAAKRSISANRDEDEAPHEADDESAAFNSARDARRHMLAKGHCKVSWENGAQIGIDGIYEWELAADGCFDEGNGCEMRGNSKLTDGDLILASGTRLRNRSSATPRALPPSSTTTSALTRRPPSSSLTITHHTKTLPGNLPQTILSLKKSDRTAILRCTRAELTSLAACTPSELARVASGMNVATRQNAGTKAKAYLDGAVKFNAARRVGGSSTKPKGAMGFGLYTLNT